MWVFNVFFGTQILAPIFWTCPEISRRMLSLRYARVLMTTEGSCCNSAVSANFASWTISSNTEICTSAPGAEIRWVKGHSLIYACSFGWLVPTSVGRSCLKRRRTVDRSTPSWQHLWKGQQSLPERARLCSDELAGHSCPLLWLHRQVAKYTSGLFYCWSLLRNNTMATNLQVFAWTYGSRRFAACDCWTQTSVANLAVSTLNLAANRER